MQDLFVTPVSKGFRFKKSELGVFASMNSDLPVQNLQKGSRIMGLSRGCFSLIDLIHSILKKTGPAHVICTTWSAGIKDAHQIEWMRGSELIKSFQLITDYSFVLRQKQYAISITELFGEANIRVSDIHAKFCLIYNDDWKVIIRTSMNLNTNKTCESFEIDEDQEVFDFYFNFCNHVFGNMTPGFDQKFSASNKSLDRFFNDNQKAIQGWSDL